jgi:Rieske Fe-S protein
MDEEVSPSEPPAGDPDEVRAMWTAAAQLRASGRAKPDPAFLRSLRERLEGELRPPAPRHITRRTMLGAAAGLAAGLVAGVGLDEVINKTSTPAPTTELVGSDGRWVVVADAVQALQSRLTPFQAGALSGFLVSDGQGLHAVSSVCTHMACNLRPSGQGSETFLQCPCHGATFDLAGKQTQWSDRPYPTLASLPKIKVKVSQGQVWVWTV